MRSRERRTAERFHILDRIESLENDLLKIKYCDRVDFDLDGFYDNTGEVIILTGYDIPLSSETYFKDRTDFITAVKETAKGYGLVRTLDKIEDYGRDFYIVFEIRDKELFYKGVKTND